MKLYKIMLAIATLLTGLAAGVYVTFTFLILPGIHRLDDASFIKSYQAADSNFQANPPNIQKEENYPPAAVFVVPFFLAAAALVASLILGFSRLSAIGRIVLSAALVLYSFFGLGTTLVGNVPRNTKIQTAVVDTMSEQELSAVRQEFEPSWMRLSIFRSIASTTAFALLIVMLLHPKSFAARASSSKSR